MVKFIATAKDGSKVVGLGLSDANLELLRQRRPIEVHLGAELIPGSDLSVALFWGPTENDLVEELKAAGGVERFIDHRPDDVNPSNPHLDPRTTAETGEAPTG